MLPGVWGVVNMSLRNQAPTQLRFVCATHRGVQRGEAPRRCHQSPNPKPQEGAGIPPCRGFGGVPQFHYSSSKSGGRGLNSTASGSLCRNSTKQRGGCGTPRCLVHVESRGREIQNQLFRTKPTASSPDDSDTPMVPPSDRSRPPAASP